MNEENMYLKLLYLVAFIAFASVSCWATAESLHMLLPSWPHAFCYVVSIGFFIIASLGAKMIFDSLNQDIYLEKRGWRLIGGIIIVLLFWLVCSMPTNTHTFFYRHTAPAIAKEDVILTKGYLTQLTDDVKTEDKIKTKQKELDNMVKSKLTDLETEIMNEVNPGFGPRADEILRQFADLLDVAKVDPISYTGGASLEKRKKLVDQYRKKIYALDSIKQENIRASMTATNKEQYQNAAKTASINIQYIADEMNNDPSALNKVEFAHEVDNRLLIGYATIKTYNNFIDFIKETDRERYTAENPVTKIKRLMSVFDVWQDIIKGQYKGHGFIFWILLSILVDIAAFLFFYMAFKKEDE